MDYYEKKYLKYKSKYLDLKKKSNNQIGGANKLGKLVVPLGNALLKAVPQKFQVPSGVFNETVPKNFKSEHPEVPPQFSSPKYEPYPSQAPSQVSAQAPKQFQVPAQFKLEKYEPYQFQVPQQINQSKLLEAIRKNGPFASMVENHGLKGSGEAPGGHSYNELIPVSTPTKPASYPAKKYFIVYGAFEDKVAPLLKSVLDTIKINPSHRHPTFKKTILEPHTSIVYEPEYEIKNDSDFEAYKTIIERTNNINELYPNISKFLKDLDSIDDLVLEGASAFFRENIVIIKIGFNSKKMNDTRNTFYSSSPEMKEHERKWREKVKNPRIREKYGRSRYYADDETFNEENPKLWIHTTVAALNPETTSIEEIDTYLDQIQDSVKGEIGKIFSINQIKIRDPEMLITPIWKKN